MPILRIDHIGVAVRSLDQAAAQFKALLGLEIAAQENVEDQQLVAALIPTADVRFELLEPTAPESVVGRFLERRGEGVHHICFEVDDIQQEIESLKSREVQLVQGAPRQGFVGQVEFLHPRSAGGVLVEIAQVELRTHVSTETRLHHVSIATNDLGETAGVWKRNLQLTEQPTGKYTQGTEGAHATWLDTPEGQGKALVEFVTPISGASAVAEFLTERGTGVFALALQAPAGSPALQNAQNSKALITPDQLVGLRVVIHQK